MRWVALISGQLVVPASKRAAWLAAELDWKSVEGSAVLKGYISGETVAEIVDDVNFDEPTEFLAITTAGETTQLRSFQSQAGFSESMVGFAAAWAAAAKFGGVGELVGVGVGSRFGYRIRVESGQASVTKLDDMDLDALVATPELVAMCADITARGGAMAAALDAAAKLPPVAARVAKPVAADPMPAAKKPAAKKPAAKKATAKKPAAKTKPT